MLTVKRAVLAAVLVAAAGAARAHARDMRRVRETDAVNAGFRAGQLAERQRRRNGAPVQTLPTIAELRERRTR